MQIVHTEEFPGRARKKLILWFTHVQLLVKSNLMSESEYFSPVAKENRSIIRQGSWVECVLIGIFIKINIFVLDHYYDL